MGIGTGTSTASVGGSSSTGNVAIVVVVVVVVAGEYRVEGGKTTSLTMIGTSGPTEFGKSNSSEKLGGQFLCDLGSSKWA